MNIVLIILAVVCILIGIAGAIVPGLPGPPISWIALLLLHLTHNTSLTIKSLIFYGIAAAIITVVDYIVPVWGTKRLGGTRAGTWGSTIGLIVGIFILPLLGITIGPMGIVGLLLGPFVGAYIGEKLCGNANKALRSAFGSFLGFLAGTAIKLIYGFVVAIYATILIIH